MSVGELNSVAMVFNSMWGCPGAVVSICAMGCGAKYGHAQYDTTARMRLSISNVVFFRFSGYIDITIEEIVSSCGDDASLLCFIAFSGTY